jgi:hypothetical protein
MPFTLLRVKSWTGSGICVWSLIYSCLTERMTTPRRRHEFVRPQPRAGGRPRCPHGRPHRGSKARAWAPSPATAWSSRVSATTWNSRVSAWCICWGWRRGRHCVRIDGPRRGELGFLFIFKTLMRNLNKFNLHNSRSPNSPNTS